MIKRLALLCLIVAPHGGLADEGGRHDHDNARTELQAARALPLATLLPATEAAYGGRVIDVKLERDDGSYVYEFRLITPDGRLIEVKLDAANGRLVEIEGHGTLPDKDDD